MHIAMSCAVVDAGGQLIAFERMDGADLVTITLAQDKAWTALVNRMPTGDLAALAQPGAEFYGYDSVAGGRTIIDQTLFRLAQTITRRGLAVVISDFLGAENACTELLRQLHGQGQEVLVFHLMSPEELDLPYDGELLIEDSETAEEIPINAEAFREEYQKRVSEFCERVRKECLKLEIDYQRLRTDIAVGQLEIHGFLLPEQRMVMVVPVEGHDRAIPGLGDREASHYCLPPSLARSSACF
jgi:hypothetical protein